MTDERTDEEFIAEVIRRGSQTSEEWKIETLMKLYQPEHKDWDWTEPPFDGEARQQLRQILDARWTREEPRGCTNKRCNGKERKPCRLLQYIEICTKCGTRMGEVPTQTWGNN